jgi:HK97 family phage prohead protease
MNKKVKNLLASATVKSFKQVGDDYQDVIISGYASTYEHDRYGEYFLKGAWTEAITKYLATNPVLLLDHDYQVEKIAGKVELLREDEKGLYFEAAITNDPAFKSLRYRLKEGIINSISVGGWWTYDKKAIVKVEDLYEISIVAVPANAGAVVEAKDFSNDSCTLAGLKVV